VKRRGVRRRFWRGVERRQRGHNSNFYVASHFVRTVPRMNILGVAVAPVKLLPHTSGSTRPDGSARTLAGLHEYVSTPVPLGAKIWMPSTANGAGATSSQAKSANRYCSKCWPLILTLNQTKGRQLVSHSFTDSGRRVLPHVHGLKPL